MSPEGCGGTRKAARKSFCARRARVTCSATYCMAAACRACAESSLGSDHATDCGVSSPRLPPLQTLAVLAEAVPGVALPRPRCWGLFTACCNMESWVRTICASSLTCRSNCSADLEFSSCTDRAVCNALKSLPPLMFAWPKPESSAVGAIRRRSSARLRTHGRQRTNHAMPRSRGQRCDSNAVSTLCSRKRLSFVRRPARSAGSWKRVRLQPCSSISRRTVREQALTHSARRGSDTCASGSPTASSASRCASISSSSAASREREISEMAKMLQRTREMEAVHQIRVRAPHACAASCRRTSCPGAHRRACSGVPPPTEAKPAQSGMQRPVANTPKSPQKAWTAMAEGGSSILKRCSK
mmetsp:Transcript_111787/g.356782  ORF Transcript_111787/g.356782 Transcript_111787/m.356782 type:complete len:356 (+) Transcript_111787:262-1329(+)